MTKLVASFLVGILVLGLMIPTGVFADVSTPKKQTKLGISPDNVICKENLFKVILKSNGKPLCVKPETAIKMIERAITKSTNTNMVKAFMEQLENKTPVGQVRKVSVLGIEASSKVFRTSPPFASFKVIFEVCATNLPLRSPEIILASQSATNYVKIANDIPANTCEINAGTVAAINPETIELTLVNKGGITEKINQLQNKVSELKKSLESEKSKLSARIQEGNVEKQRERISSIVELRSELNQAREELNRYLFALNVSHKINEKDLVIPKTFTGTPIEDVSITLLAANKQLVQEGFDVAFEMCAASQTVRIPLVVVTSDLESKKVRLSDRIIPNTCQVSGVKIMASEPGSIKVTIGETSDKSSSVESLEMKISELSESLQAEKRSLRDLTHFAPRPSNFDEQAAQIADNIIALRGQITLLKTQLFSLLNEIYK